MPSRERPSSVNPCERSSHSVRRFCACSCAVAQDYGEVIVRNDRLLPIEEARHGAIRAELEERRGLLLADRQSIGAPINELTETRADWPEARWLAECPLTQPWPIWTGKRNGADQ